MLFFIFDLIFSRLLSARDRKQKVTLRPRSSENNETSRRRITSSKTRPKNTDNSTPRPPNQREEFPSIKNTNTKVDEGQIGLRDHTSQSKSRPKTDGNDSRRGSRTGQKISLAPAKQNRFHGKLLYDFIINLRYHLDFTVLPIKSRFKHLVQDAKQRAARLRSQIQTLSILTFARFLAHCFLACMLAFLSSPPTGGSRRYQRVHLHLSDIYVVYFSIRHSGLSDHKSV